MKSMLEQVKSDTYTRDISTQDQGRISNRIEQLGKLSYDFISKAYADDQNQTISFLKEPRIGGYSIIGESL